MRDTLAPRVSARAEAVRSHVRILRVADHRESLDQFPNPVVEREGRPKTGQMSASIRIWNRIGEGKNLIVIAVVILQNAIDEYLILLYAQNNWFRVNDLLAFA